MNILKDWDRLKLIDRRRSTDYNLTSAFKNAFQYAAFSERNYLQNLDHVGAYSPGDKAENSFIRVLSLAEYCEQANPKKYPHMTTAVEDAIMRSAKCWRFDADYIADICRALLAKFGEHLTIHCNENAKFRAFSNGVHTYYEIYYNEKALTFYDFVMNELYKGDENAEIMRAKIDHALD